MRHVSTTRMTAGAIAIAAVVAGWLFAGAGVDVAFAEQWEVESGDDRQQRIMERYRSMLEENPVEGTALDRLLGYVGRGSGLDRLINDYEQRVEARPDHFNLRLVLGHLLKERGDYEEAFHHYDRAVQLDSSASLGWLSRGTVHLLTGERRRAMSDFEEALERESDRSRRHEILRQLGELSFSQRDFERGKEFFDRLLSAKPRDRFLRMEYVSLLVQYRQLDEAIAQYQALRPSVAGDTRQTATLLRDKADVYEMKGDHRAALETYEEAKAMVRADSWLAREIRQQIVEVFRRSGALDEFLDQYGRRWSRGSTAQQMMVADVYRELGRLEDALELYERAARRDASAVEPRQKAIRVLERLGRDDEIPAAYRALMRAAPNDERYAFELADHYMRLGNRDEAQAVLDEIERQFAGQSYVLLRLAERYAQWNFGARAQSTYETVLEREGDDDAVLIEVGDYYYDRGNRQRAIEIWEQLPQSRLGEREGSRRMAELMVQRGIMSEGIEAFEQLVEEAPEDERLLRAMARALERANRLDEALERWEQLLDVTDRPRRKREARSRMVQLYERQQALRARMRDWEHTFETDDLVAGQRAGFFLAEAHLQLREFDRAEQILVALRDDENLTDDDRTAVLLALEQTYVRAERYDDAIAVLEVLSEHQPDMRRELLERKSEHALAGRSHEAAVEFAGRALETNPDDARAQARMGRVYRDLDDLESAATHFRTAADIDPRDYEVRVELGKALAQLGERGSAEEVLMEVVENATEDQLIRDAGERLLEMARRDGRLDALENQWSPLVFRMPVRHAHAQLMFQLYDRIAGPLLMEGYHASPARRAEARARLYELGGRAAPLMVEQLQRDDGSSKARALRLAAEMQIELVAPQVGRIIARGDDERIRKMAIVTAARLGDDQFVESLQRALEDGSATVRHLATWALGFIDSDAARDALVEIADTEVDGTGPRLAVLGLGEHGGGESRRVVAAHLRRLVDDPVAMDGDRAALLLAVAAGEVVGAGGDEFRPMIVRLSEDRRDSVGRWAARVLGIYGDPEAAASLWRLALSDDPVTARHGRMGLAQMLADSPQAPTRDWSREVRFFDWTGADFDARRLLRSAAREWSAARPTVGDGPWTDAVAQGLSMVLTADEAATPAAMNSMNAELEGLQTAVLWNRTRAQQFATAVLDSPAESELASAQRMRLEVLADPSRHMPADGDGVDEETLRHLFAAIAGAGQDSETGLSADAYLRALKASDHRLRRMALNTLHSLPGDDAQRQRLTEAIVEALHDSNTSVQLAAVRTTGRLNLAEATEPLAELEREARPSLRRAVRQARRSLQ